MMALETTDLGRRFKRSDGLRKASLRVPEGSALALIGANGAGKTTLLRILVNVLRPTAGSARVLGKDSRTLTAADFNRIGYVAENQKLPERLTVEHFFAYLGRLYTRWDGRLAQRLLRDFELPPRRPIGKLSHGMRMKVMLTGALAFRPELLLLDEPLTGLDPLTRDEVVAPGRRDHDRHLVARDGRGRGAGHRNRLPRPRVARIPAADPGAARTLSPCHRYARSAAAIVRRPARQLAAGSGL